MSKLHIVGKQPKPEIIKWRDLNPTTRLSILNYTLMELAYRKINVTADQVQKLLHDMNARVGFQADDNSFEKIGFQFLPQDWEKFLKKLG